MKKKKKKNTFPAHILFGNPKIHWAMLDCVSFQSESDLSFSLTAYMVLSYSRSRILVICESVRDVISANNYSTNQD